MEKQKQKIILIVDDEKSHKNILSDKLKKEGFKTVLASNGEEGFEKALELHPDLIILDIKMPILNGIDMLEKIRKEDWGLKTKVIILSSYQYVNEISKAMDLGTYDYLVKTEIKIESIVERVKQKLA